MSQILRMFSLLHGVLGMVLCIAIMPGFLRRFTTDPTLVDMGVTYSTIVFLFSLVNMADLAFEKIFQSVGRMNVAMVALITGCVTNIALDPVLIFGLGPVPALGIAGAALATGIGQAVSLVVSLLQGFLQCAKIFQISGKVAGAGVLPQGGRHGLALGCRIIGIKIMALFFGTK